LLLSTAPSFATNALPPIVHILLLQEQKLSGDVRNELSAAFGAILVNPDHALGGHKRLVIDNLLYLRSCAKPGEATMADRSAWLDVTYSEAAAAAVATADYSTALLFIEVDASQRSLQTGRSSRRSTAAIIPTDSKLEATVFQHLGDPDFFYGNYEEASIESIINKLDHERDGYKALSFKSASFDSSIKLVENVGQKSLANAMVVVDALSAANLHGIASAVRSYADKLGDGSSTKDSLEMSLNLHEWDLNAGGNRPTYAQALQDVFRIATTSSSKSAVLSQLDASLLNVVDAISKGPTSSIPNVQYFSTLAILSEIKGFISRTNIDEAEEVWQKTTSLSTSPKHQR